MCSIILLKNRLVGAFLKDSPSRYKICRQNVHPSSNVHRGVAIIITRAGKKVNFPNFSPHCHTYLLFSSFSSFNHVDLVLEWAPRPPGKALATLLDVHREFHMTKLTKNTCTLRL